MKTKIKILLLVLLVGNNFGFCQVSEKENDYCFNNDIEYYDIFDHNPVKNIFFNDSTKKLVLNISILNIKFPWKSEKIIVIFKDRQRKQIFRTVSPIQSCDSVKKIYNVEFKYTDVFACDDSMKNVFSDEYRINEIFLKRYCNSENVVESKKAVKRWYVTSFDGNDKVDTLYYKLRKFYYNEMRNDKAQQEFLQHRDEILFEKYEKAAESFTENGEIAKDFEKIKMPLDELRKLYEYFTTNSDPYIKEILYNSFQDKANRLFNSIKSNNSYKYQKEIIDSLDKFKSLIEAANGLPIPINLISPVISDPFNYKINQIESQLNQIIEMIAIQSELSNYHLRYIEKQIIPVIRRNIKEVSLIIPINEDKKMIIIQKYDSILFATNYLYNHIKISPPDPMENHSIEQIILKHLPFRTIRSGNTIPFNQGLTLMQNRIDNIDLTTLIESVNPELKNTFRSVLLNKIYDFGISDSIYRRETLKDINISREINNSIKRLIEMNLSTFGNADSLIDTLNFHFPSPTGIAEVKNIIYDHKRMKDNRIDNILEELKDPISNRILNDEKAKTRYQLDSTKATQLLHRLVLYYSAKTISPQLYKFSLRKLKIEANRLNKIKVTSLPEERGKIIYDCENELAKLDEQITSEFNRNWFDSIYKSPQILLVNELKRLDELVKNRVSEVTKQADSIKTSIYRKNFNLILSLKDIPFSYYDSIKAMVNRLTVLNNNLEDHNREIVEYRDRNMLNETFYPFWNNRLSIPSAEGLGTRLYGVFQPKKFYTVNDYRRDSTFVVNLLKDFPEVTEYYYFNEMPYKKRAEFFEKSLQTKDSISKYLNIDVDQIDEEALAYHLSKRLNVNEKKLAENLSHKINFLNMDTYVGLGLCSWKDQDSKTSYQPFSLIFTTRLDTSNNYTWKYKPLGINKAQPYFEGNLQVFSGRGAMAEFGYGIRLLNSGKPKGSKKAKLCISVSGSIQSAFLNTETWKFNNKETGEDSLFIKSFYEVESGGQFKAYLYWPNGTKLGLNVGYSEAIPSIIRTYNLVAAENHSSVFTTKTADYWAITGSFFFSTNLFRLSAGLKSYKINDPEELITSYNQLFYVQLQFRLNRN